MLFIGMTTNQTMTVQAKTTVGTTKVKVVDNLKGITLKVTWKKVSKASLYPMYTVIDKGGDNVYFYALWQDPKGYGFVRCQAFEECQNKCEEILTSCIQVKHLADIVQMFGCLITILVEKWLLKSNRELNGNNNIWEKDLKRYRGFSIFKRRCWSSFYERKAHSWLLPLKCWQKNLNKPVIRTILDLIRLKKGSRWLYE